MNNNGLFCCIFLWSVWPNFSVTCLETTWKWLQNLLYILSRIWRHWGYLTPWKNSQQWLPFEWDSLMETLSNENIFRLVGPLWGESNGHQWIPLTKTSDAELWFFLGSAPEQTIKQIIETLVIRDAIALIMTHCYAGYCWCHIDLNTMRRRQNGRHFPDDIFKCTFWIENGWISIQI